MAISLPFIDSFDHYAYTPDRLKKWDIATQFNSFAAEPDWPTPIGVGQIYRHVGLGAFAQNLDQQYARIAFGSPVRHTNQEPFGGTGVHFEPSTIYFVERQESFFKVELKFSNDGRVKVVIPTEAFLTRYSDTTAQFLHSNTYHKIEWEIEITESTDWPTVPHFFTSKVWIEDVQVMDVPSTAFGGGTPLVRPNKVSLGDIQISGQAQFYGDIYIDTSRHRNTRVVALRPNADTSPQQWNPAASHFPLLDETILDVNDKITAPNPGLEDLILHEDAPGNINGVPSLVQPVFYGEWDEGVVKNLYDGVVRGDGVSGRFTFHTLPNGVTTDGTSQGVRYDA